VPKVNERKIIPVFLLSSAEALFFSLLLTSVYIRANLWLNFSFSQRTLR